MSKKIELPLDKVLEVYNETQSINAVAKYFQVHWGVAKRHCDELGILNDTHKNQYGNYEQYNLFTKIETEEDAYWLGILYADGWVRSDKNEIGLGAQEKDVDLIYKWKTYTGSQNKISVKRKEDIKPKVAPDGHLIKATQDFYTLTFSSKITKDNLSSLGCLPNKSKILHCPTIDQVPDSLIRHFARGFCDGDGSIRWGKRKSFELVSASINFLVELTTRLKIINYGTFRDKMRFNVYRQEDVKKILDLLYKDAQIYLDRKYKLYLQSN